MKKSIATFVLLFVLSLSVFAEGEIGTGGKSCPNGQTSCLVAAPEIPQQPEETTLISKVFDYLKSVFR